LALFLIYLIIYLYQYRLISNFGLKLVLFLLHQLTDDKTYSKALVLGRFIYFKFQRFLKDLLRRGNLGCEQMIGNIGKYY
jgi:hypothetical protein